MEQNTLIQILRTFDSKQMKAFKLFVESPFFNKNINVIKLFSLLEKQHPRFKAIFIQKELLFQKIFPGKKYLDENMKTLIYLLTRLSEKFIVYADFQSEPYGERNRLLVSLDKRKLDKLFYKYEKQTSELHNNVRDVSLEALYEKTAFEKIRRDFYSERNAEEKIYEHETTAGNYLISAFFIELFRNNISFERTKHRKIELGHSFANAVIKNIDMANLVKILKEHSFENISAIEIYSNLYKLLTEDEDAEKYKKFRLLLSQNSARFSKNEQFILSTLLVNILHYKQIDDNTKHTAELFEAYKLLLSLYEYSGRPHLRSVIYTNALRLGIQLKEYKWTEDYIKKYTPLLPDEDIDNMMHYSMAYLSFTKGDFEKALGFIIRINFNTFQMKYHIRNLQLMIYFELSDFDAALTLIDAYRHFIKKERKFSEKIKQSYMEFVSCTYRLLKIKMGDEETGIKADVLEIIKNKVEKSNPMRKAWLLDKIDELKEITRTHPYS